MGKWLIHSAMDEPQSMPVSSEFCDSWEISEALNELVRHVRNPTDERISDEYLSQTDFDLVNQWALETAADNGIVVPAALLEAAVRDTDIRVLPRDAVKKLRHLASKTPAAV